MVQTYQLNWYDDINYQHWAIKSFLVAAGVEIPKGFNTITVPKNYTVGLNCREFLALCLPGDNEHDPFTRTCLFLLSIIDKQASLRKEKLIISADLLAMIRLATPCDGVLCNPGIHLFCADTCQNHNYHDGAVIGDVIKKDIANNRTLMALEILTMIATFPNLVTLMDGRNIPNIVISGCKFNIEDNQPLAHKRNSAIWFHRTDKKRTIEVTEIDLAKRLYCSSIITRDNNTRELVPGQ